MITLPMIINFLLLSTFTNVNGLNLNNSDIHFIVTTNNNNNNPPKKMIIELKNETVADEHPRLFSLQAIKSSFLSEIFGKENTTKESTMKNVTNLSGNNHKKNRPNTKIRVAVRKAAEEGFNAVIDLYEKREREIVEKGNVLDSKSPGAQLAAFSAPVEGYDNDTKLAYGAIFTAKKLKER